MALQRGPRELAIDRVESTCTNSHPSDTQPCVACACLPLLSVLSLTAVVTGAYLLWHRFEGQWDALFTTGQGHAFLFGGTVAILLTTFHFAIEPQLDGMICTAADNDDLEVTARVVRLLQIIPRVGMVVILAIFLAMMIGARGF